MKRCCRCKEVKEFLNFGLLKSSSDGYRHDCKSCRSDYTRLNKSKISEYKKNHYIENKEYILNKNKKYYEENRDVMDIYMKNYWMKEENKERRKYNYNKWKFDNIDNIREYKRIYYKEVTMNCPVKRLKYSIRSSIRRVMKNKSVSSEFILGCSYEEFKVYIESKFENWMSWDNYGLYNGELSYGWDIDHIIPLSSANTEEEVIELNNYTNLQPLCSKFNRDIKNDKIDFNI